MPNSKTSQVLINKNKRAKFRLWTRKEKEQTRPILRWADFWEGVWHFSQLGFCWGIYITILPVNIKMNENWVFFFIDILTINYYIILQQ